MDEAVPNLKGKTALVTGASKGAGRAMALALAKAGAHVLALARTVGALEELDDEIRAAGGAATLGNADPQVRILTDLSGLADNRVQLALTLILAVMVEFGSGLGLFVTFGHGHIGHRIQPRLVSELAIIDPTAEKHTASDQDWARQRLILDPHAHTLAVALYEDYCWWCKKEGRRDPISPAEFEPWLRSQGLDVSRKLAGRNHYLGVRLRTTNDVVADFRAEETLATA